MGHVAEKRASISLDLGKCGARTITVLPNFPKISLDPLDNIAEGLIAAEFFVHPTQGIDNGAVVAVAEAPSDFHQREARRLLCDIHRHLTG